MLAATQLRSLRAAREVRVDVALVSVLVVVDVELLALGDVVSVLGEVDGLIELLELGVVVSVLVVVLVLELVVLGLVVLGLVVLGLVVVLELVLGVVLELLPDVLVCAYAIPRAVTNAVAAAAAVQRVDCLLMTGSPVAD